MNKKFYWGIATLILLLGIGSLFFILQPDPEPQKVFKVPSVPVPDQANGLDISDSAFRASAESDDSADALFPEKMPTEPIARKVAEGYEGVPF